MINVFFNYPINRSNGTAILCISSDFKIYDTLYLDNGRTTIVQLQKGNIKFTIVNVYAPTIVRSPHFAQTFSLITRVFLGL